MKDRKPPEVGLRLRMIRTRLGLSLRAVAERSGLSINAISRIERGEASPTVLSLHSLSTALRVPITELLAEANEHDTIFVPHDQRLRSGADGIVMESLGTGLRGQQIEPFLVVLEKGGSTLPREVAHKGHEFVLCLEGVVEYRVDGERYRLEHGDSLLFEAGRPHSCRNAGPERARLLVLFQAAGGAHIARQQHLAVSGEASTAGGDEPCHDRRHESGW